jgi:hypothetical protein
MCLFNIGRYWELTLAVDDTIVVLIFFLSFSKLAIAMPIFRSLALRH